MMQIVLRILALIKKEFLAVWQDNPSRAVLIVPPILQLILFSFAATLDVKNVSIGIINRDSGQQSNELVQRFSGAPVFTRIIFVKNTESIADEINNQDVVAVIHIDDQFSKNLLSKKSADVQVILDGRKSNSTQIVFGYINQIVDQYNSDIAKIAGVQGSNIVLIQRNWFNPNLHYPWFTVPGLVAILTMLIGLVVTALSVAREKELGTFEQLLVTPLTPIQIIIGKIIPGIFIGMTEGTFILLAAIFVFHIPFTGSILSLYFGMFVFICAIVGIGLFISCLCKTQQQASLGVLLFMVPAVTLSGFATPIENMPVWLQTVTEINPLRHFLVISRGCFLKELPFQDVLTYIYPMVLIAAFNITAATWFFRKRLE